MNDPRQDPAKMRRRTIAETIVRRWLERAGPACRTCGALTELYLDTAAAIYYQNNRVEESVWIEGSDLVMLNGFGDDDPTFRRVFTQVQGTYYRSADGRCPDCGTAWKYEYDAHGGWSGLLRAVGAR